MPETISVIGAGSWGTTLAMLLEKKKYDVTLWVFDPADLELMKAGRINARYLPGILLPENLKLTNDLKAAVMRGDCLVLAFPPM